MRIGVPKRAKRKGTFHMSVVNVRTAEPVHLPEVHRMLIALAAHHGDAATITPADLSRLVFQSPATRLLVACLSDSPAPHPVGYALLVARQNLVTGQVGYVMDHLFVQQPFRRAGVGRALIAAARELTLEEGRSGLTISTHPANTDAQAAYRAMGLAELPVTGPRFAVALA